MDRRSVLVRRVVDELMDGSLAVLGPMGIPDFATSFGPHSLLFVAASAYLAAIQAALGLWSSPYRPQPRGHLAWA